eukprot:5518003-Amphidinium_carterae.1
MSHTRSWPLAWCNFGSSCSRVLCFHPACLACYILLAVCLACFPSPPLSLPPAPLLHTLGLLHHAETVRLLASLVGPFAHACHPPPVYHSVGSLHDRRAVLVRLALACRVLDLPLSCSDLGSPFSCVMC